MYDLNWFGWICLVFGYVVFMGTCALLGVGLMLGILRMMLRNPTLRKVLEYLGLVEESSEH